MAVAVAYLSAGMFGQLPLGTDDVLVVDVSERAVRNGSTDPAEVRRYVNADVRVFRRQGLHAKVFVLGDTLIVGSANVSKRSSSGGLIEAAYLPRTRRDVSTAREWISAELTTRPVTVEYLDRVSAMVPARAPIGPSRHGSEEPGDWPDPAAVHVHVGVVAPTTWRKSTNLKVRAALFDLFR